LFATDFPVTTVEETIIALRGVNRLVEGTPLPRVSEEAIDQIIHRDALALLEL
jgi:hypothetical protein